jgi:PAS domain S-box-containing protein
MTVNREDCTILLVDDEPAALEVRGHVLERLGYKVLSAKTGVEGLALFQSRDVDVVVTDHLAGLAYGLASSMKRLKPHVPIISFSGSAEPEKTRTYADVCIRKEEGPQALIGALDEIVAKMGRTIKPARPGKQRLTPLPEHALLSTIVEDSCDAILSKTLDGVIISWNRAAELMYGYTKDEAIGSSVTMLLPDDRKDEFDRYMERLAGGERISNYESVRVAKNGSKLNVLLTISPIRDSGKHIVGASTIARDITAQKLAEQALQRAEKLALIGRMAATVAHEINNPLEAVSNILYLLRNSVQLNSDARKFVELACEELDRVMQITQLTLGMQRGSSRDPVSLEVTPLLENVLTLYVGRTKKLGIKVVRHYSEKGTLVGFPVELQQVFSNLIVNAMDAMSTRGDKLVLGVRRARRPKTGESGVRISVLDNGPGIAPEHIGHLFQPFYTTKGEQGTGIGLWVSRNIVQKHRGTLRVHSSVRPGRTGTCFSIFLPLGKANTMPKAA